MAPDKTPDRPRREGPLDASSAANSPSAAEATRMMDTRLAGNHIRAHSLADFRKASKMTQLQVAARLETDQGTVSKIERRGDLLLSTIRQYLAATGCVNARIVAEVEDAEISLTLSDFV